jgi:tetratricopeptide (TPR) repeat protein
MARINLIIVVALCLGLTDQVTAQEALWKELDQTVNKLYEEGKYAEATRIAERAVEVASKTFGPDHPNVVTSLNDVAQLYQQQGKYSEAEPFYKRSLAIREKALGKDPRGTAVALTNLALLYESQ